MASGHVSIFVFVLWCTIIPAIRAEQHSVNLVNNCGYGTFSGRAERSPSTRPLKPPFREGCTLVELTLVNPSTAGSGSSVDISLIPPLAFSVAATFSYYDGCDGTGNSCLENGCTTAFYEPDDTTVQVACQDDNKLRVLINVCLTG
ncbi:hypothetical protein FISHEDRAFT_62799 [Fistulina hepatica ATCC 64428]|uniref:Glycopeptide n=1 Tax=Fistulina hepatica ATCC 64428 TaxID=1128425 RepID=A0A0D6ZZM2_9AGAR|nr:hypothetical protein FISHEDRAFT_62799 [Fistulina hepatica ATCC 64428]